MDGPPTEAPVHQAGHWVQGPGYLQYIPMLYPYVHSDAVQWQPWAIGTLFQPLPFTTPEAAHWPSLPNPDPWGQVASIDHNYPFPNGQIVHSLQPSNYEVHVQLDQHPIVYQYVPFSTAAQEVQVPSLPSQASPPTMGPYFRDRPPPPDVTPIVDNLNTPIDLVHDTEPPPPYPGFEEFAPAPSSLGEVQIDLEADIHPFFTNYDRLTNPIHPLFQRQNFTTQTSPADEPVLLPRDQYAFLKPALRLGSHLISNSSALSAWAWFLDSTNFDPSAEQNHTASAAFDDLISNLRFCIGGVDAPILQQANRTTKAIPRRVFAAILTATTSARWADSLMHQFGLAVLLIQLVASCLPFSDNDDEDDDSPSSVFRLGSDYSDIAAQRITRALFGVRGLKVVVVPIGDGAESVTVQHTTRLEEGSRREGWFPVHLMWVKRFFEDGFWEGEEAGVWRGLVVPGERRSGEGMVRG